MQVANTAAYCVVSQLAIFLSSGIGLLLEKIDEPINELAIHILEDNLAVILLKVITGRDDVIAEAL